MRKLYEKINELNLEDKRILFTILDGPFAGNKLLLCNNEIVYDSLLNNKTDGSNFFLDNLESLRKVLSSGQFVLEKTTVYAESFENEKKLYVCGGGHCSYAIVKTAKLLGFYVTVLEDRKEFAESCKIAGADEVLLGDYVESFRKIKGDSDSYFVVVTRGHTLDKVCVEQAIQKKRAYCGMIGSKTHSAIVKNALIAQNYPIEDVDSVYSPIGLKINAETPEEIAISIMAEIIQIKNRIKGSFGIPQKILKTILSMPANEKMILATIIFRSGSGPRSEGSKMLVLRNGTIAGTIGGGGAEAAVIKESVNMLIKGEDKAKILSFEMDNKSAEKEGMVCGGKMNVLMEIID